MPCRSPFYKSFYHKVLHVWNSLPYHIRSIPDTSNFKNKIKTYFWQELARAANPCPALGG